MNHSRRMGKIDTDWPHIYVSIRHALERLFWAILLPIRLVATAWRLAVAVGLGIIRFSVELGAAMLGLTFVLFVGYCLARALLHPLF